MLVDVYANQEDLMKAAILSASLVLVSVIMLRLCPAVSADTTHTVVPIVHVIETYAGALTVGGDVDESGVLDFGYLVAGGEPVTRTLSLNVTANASWQVTLTSTQNLRDAGTGDTIAPDQFPFTSGGDPGPAYVTSDTPFRTSEHSLGEEVTVDTVTDGPQSEGFQVDVTYRLEIPVTQPEGYYSAGNHVYTLIVGE